VAEPRPGKNRAMTSSVMTTFETIGAQASKAASAGLAYRENDAGFVAEPGVSTSAVPWRANSASSLDEQ